MSELEMRPYSAPDKPGLEAVERRELVVVDYSDEDGAIWLGCKYVCKERDLLHHISVGDEDSFVNEWWPEQGGAEPVPATIAEAISRADELSPPVIVWEQRGDWMSWTARPMGAFDRLANRTVH